MPVSLEQFAIMMLINKSCPMMPALRGMGMSVSDLSSKPDKIPAL